MAHIPSDILRRVRAPGLVVAALMAVVPLVDAAVSAWPLRIHEASWRLTAVTLASGTTTAILFSLFLVLVIGAVVESRVPILFVAITCAGMAVLCLAGAGSFGLDALQLRGQVRPELADRFNLASSWAFMKIFFAGSVASVLAVSSFRVDASLRRTVVRHSHAPASILVGAVVNAGSSGRSTPR
jgi:hypothetical protein